MSRRYQLTDKIYPKSEIVYRFAINRARMKTNLKLRTAKGAPPPLPNRAF